MHVKIKKVFKGDKDVRFIAGGMYMAEIPADGYIIKFDASGGLAFPIYVRNTDFNLADEIRNDGKMNFADVESWGEE